MKDKTNYAAVPPQPDDLWCPLHQKRENKNIACKEARAIVTPQTLREGVQDVKEL